MKPKLFKITSTLYISEANITTITDNADGTFTITFLDATGADASEILTLTLQQVQSVFEIQSLI